MILRQVWARQFVREPAEPPADGGTVRLRGKGDPPPGAGPIESPYDAQARFRTRSGTSWVGYIVHLSESCRSRRDELLVRASPHLTSLARGYGLPLGQALPFSCGIR